MRVLIAGGGIAGLALARTLARMGLSLEVVERGPACLSAGAGVFLPGNAARALRDLGLEAQVASRAVEISRQCLYDHRGRLLSEIDVAQLWADVGPCLALHRADLHELLLEAAGDVPIRNGLAVDRLAQRNGFVLVDFSDGTTGEYDLVVGADGIHSAIRRLMFGPTAIPLPLGRVGWRFLAPRPPEVTTWSLTLGRRTTFLALPLDRDQVHCYCEAESAPGPEHGPAVTLLDTAADIHVSPVEEVALDSWVRGHVVLIGDAAHATSPNMAQGEAMALEDALVLADCLRYIRAIPNALAAFQAQRRPRTDWVRDESHRRDRARYLPTLLRHRGRQIIHANHRPLLAQP